MDDNRAPRSSPSGPRFRLVSSPHFPQWLARSGAALALTTYRSGKLFLLGVRSDGRLSIFERSFARPMGLCAGAGGRSLALATRDAIQRFDNVVPPGEASVGDYDAVFAPHASWVTGDIDVHDIAFGPDQRPLFVNTMFSCVATVSDGHSFRPLWKPPFVTRIAAEDRCHLNGMATADGSARYVTAAAVSDVADGWRERRRDGGVVIDVDSGEIAVAGLSMPHSPRLHGDRLWLINSGTGEYGWADLAAGRFEPVAFCPGYGRGLAFVAGHAVIGLSLPRESDAFTGLALDDALAARGVTPRCGLIVVDPVSGETVHRAWVEGPIRELYDVVALPGITRPAAIGFKTDEVSRVISIEI